MDISRGDKRAAEEKSQEIVEDGVSGELLPSFIDQVPNRGESFDRTRISEGDKRMTRI